MKITDKNLIDNINLLIKNYMIKNNIDFDTTTDQNKTLILHINPSNINIFIHNKNDYNGFISKKK